MTEEVNAFNEHLEDTYNFTIEEGEVNTGSCGSVNYGTMSTKDSECENKVEISVALKSKREISIIGDRLEIINKSHINEIIFFKDLLNNPEINFDSIVKCYGILNTGKKEYIVMEDLNKMGFITIDNLFKKRDTIKIESCKLKTTIEKLNIIKTYFIENKIILHGDLNCCNIMINKNDGNVKLIDFGFSYIIKDKDKLTEEENRLYKKDINNLERLIKKINNLISSQEHIEI